jgi:hypothetical protein
MLWEWVINFHVFIRVDNFLQVKHKPFLCSLNIFLKWMTDMNDSCKM